LSTSSGFITTLKIPCAILLSPSLWTVRMPGSITNITGRASWRPCMPV